MEKFTGDLKDKYTRRAVNKTIDGLMATLSAKDPYTRRHCVHVREFAVKLADKMGADEDTVIKIELASGLHDVGKIKTPLEILNKPGKLSDIERKLIEMHTVDGFEIISANYLAHISSLAGVVRHHHERWDGKGYPDKIEKDQISLESRIISVVDVYDALTTDRPYRKAMKHNKALSIIEKDSGAAFDPEVAGEFIKMSRWAASRRLWIHVKGWRQHLGR